MIFETISDVSLCLLQIYYNNEANLSDLYVVRIIMVIYIIYFRIGNGALLHIILIECIKIMLLELPKPKY